MKDSDHVKINSVNPLYIIINEVDGSISEKNENKYLTFASTDKNKEVLKKYTKLWDEIKYHIKAMLTNLVNMKKSHEYDSKIR